MAKIYKITPVDELPGRRATRQQSIYLRRDPKRFGMFAVHQRAGQVFLEKREGALRRVA